MSQKRKRFSKEEAGRLLGRHVRLVTEFADIPRGTTGLVIGRHEVEPEGFEIIVRWEGIEVGKHTTDWFTKEEFETVLVEE
ncbi:MAG: hypothetical protein M3362_04585 [Acidobacteriota bacterium]|nr:hypothetical protein [Acidobacteriota bacterium]